MNKIRINEQIALFRKRKGLTQEDLARALGVTNQAVSKWESAQCCPDIQLLPDLARVLGISADTLFGCAPLPAAEDVGPILQRKIDALPQREAFDFAFRTAVALHVLLFSKEMTANQGNPGWDTEEAVEHAERGEWGYSTWNDSASVTAMLGGTVLFSSGTPFLTNPDIRHIASVLRPLSDAKNLKIAAALYRLTASSETAYAAVGSIGEAAGIPAGETRDCLQKDLAEFVLEADGPEGGFRFKEMYMNLLPVLSLLNFR